MAQHKAPRIHIVLHRHPLNTDLVDYVITKVWWVRQGTSRPQWSQRDRVLAEGSFVHPEPLDDVRLAIRSVGQDVAVRAWRRETAAPAPGRERSGVANIPAQLANQQMLPLEPPTAPTPDDASE